MRNMKKSILSLLAALIVVLGCSKTTQAQVEKGTIIIDPYVGAPTMNMWWAMFYDIETGNPVSVVGPPISFGGRFEYMLADNFGAKLDVNYRISGLRYNEERYMSNSNSWQIGEYRYTSNVLRVMIGFNYHFVQTEALDVYTGFSAGYKDKTRAASWNGISESPGDIELLFPELPIGLRFSIGGRYYFHPNVGVNFEFGILGGSPVQAGLAVKI